MNLYALAADTLLIAHALFVLFVVASLPLIFIGALRQWHWVRIRWFRVTHLAAIAYVTAQAWTGRICPLTQWEMALRRHAGQQSYDSSFISYWLEYLLYYDAPAGLFVAAYTVFCTAVFI
ncbi:DUF2784 domain-containing protein, partial [Halieaceae bacterium]|nr:DUF2784 domain-containing protein [Halieaceae bacterium]